MFMHDITTKSLDESIVCCSQAESPDCTRQERRRKEYQEEDLVYWIVQVTWNFDTDTTAISRYKISELYHITGH